MGCQCCRMIKSYIYDPTVAVDGPKADSAGSSLYQPHYLPGGAPGGDPPTGPKQKQGFHNPGFSKSNDSTLKLEVDNNHVNYRLHSPANELHRQASAPPAEGGLYIIQPQALGPRWVTQDHSPIQVPVYPDIQDYEDQRRYGEQEHRATREGWHGSVTDYVMGSKSPLTDEIDEGVGGTPEYPCDTGDEGSVLSVDIHTSTTSLSSVDTKDDHRPPKTPELSTVESGILVTKSEDEEVQSVTDSMVAEALAALEAATAGEDFD